MNWKSVKVRFAVSMLSNGVRAAISFLTGLLLARGLQPANFGELSFLLGSFVALRSVLDLGASNAFFTLISGKPRTRRYYAAYFTWLALQFTLTSAAVLYLLPRGVLDRIWLGHSRGMILLAFAAAFLQQQIWMTVSQIGESKRRTAKVQGLNVAVAALHLAFVVALLYASRLSVTSVFVAIIIEYLLAVLWAAWLFRSSSGVEEVVDPQPEPSLRQIVGEFSTYCAPLIFLSITAFLYDFGDRWMLQRFGGSGQQGFYQISYQVAAISLLATTSILGVFWKETAEAHARGDVVRMGALYKRVNRGLVVFGAIVAAFVIPWSKDVIQLVLGNSYAMAAPVLAIMFLYPIHQSMGQIGGTMFLASRQTRTFTVLSVATMLVSLPVSYFVQAPPTAMVPGFGLGAFGLAIKMVAVGVISVNVQAYVIARSYGWKFDWVYQVVALGATLTMSFTSKYVAQSLWHPPISNRVSLLANMAIAGFFYVVMVGVLLYFHPWLVGVEKSELARATQKARRAFA